MMTKNFASNSVLRRASQFESGSSADQQQQQQQAQSSGRNIAESTQQSSVSIKRPSLSRRSITKPKDEVDDNVDHVTEDHHQKAIKTTLTSSNDHQPQPNVFLSSAYARFEREYARLYPDSPAPPFTEPANTEEAAEALRRQQARAAELSLELSKAKFAVNFLKGITSSSSSASSGSGGNADRRDSTATGNES